MATGVPRSLLPGAFAPLSRRLPCLHLEFLDFSTNTVNNGEIPRSRVNRPNAFAAQAEIIVIAQSCGCMFRLRIWISRTPNDKLVIAAVFEAALTLERHFPQM